MKRHMKINAKIPFQPSNKMQQLENPKIALKAARAVSKNKDEHAAIYVKLNLENDTPLRSLLKFCPQVEWKEYWLLRKFDLKNTVKFSRFNLT